ncbi:MAG: ATP-binding protein [Caldilineales bacterium]|nr:ATP-binding protein [Caldilineales bacterium]MCW5860945.1 ATP-binding protein [Caldilineales bacterium]
MFRNRQRELGYLESRYARPGAEFAVLYGRRRVGKSSLIYEWCREKPHLYFFAARLPGQALLHEFGRQLAAALGQPERTFANWDSALFALAELAGEQRFVVVIDEYPYLADSVPGFSTLLQRAWDTVLQHTRLFLCLTGSTFSVVRREILDGSAPLYRRHTWAYELMPLQPSDLAAFFPDLDAEQLIETYAVLGGMPRNLLSFAPELSLMRNIGREILDPSGGLFSEVRLLLHEELKGEVDAYGRVLAALAAGHHRRQDAAAAANLTLASLQHYLNDLVTNGLVEHRLPLNREREDGRLGAYHILDPFLRFWHRWIAPHRALLEIGQRQDETLSEIRNNLPYIVAPVWESLARQHLLTASGRGQIPFSVQEVGSWWARGAQVDLVGVNRADHRVVFGEARWRSTPVTTADLKALMEKGLLWLRGDTARWDVHYAFFARNLGQIETAGMDEENIHLFTPEDVTLAGPRP